MQEERREGGKGKEREKMKRREKKREGKCERRDEEGKICYKMPSIPSNAIRFATVISHAIVNHDTDRETVVT